MPIKLLLLAVAVASLTFYAGCNSQVEQVPIGGSGAPPEYYGLAPLEETIAGSDVIARVRLRSVTAAAERFDGQPGYIAALEFRFRVLEYLRGSGANELVALVTDSGRHYSSTSDAIEAANVNIKDERDTRWDSHDAIIFLIDDWELLPSTSQANRYWLGSALGGIDYYTLVSRHHRAWLPDFTSGAGGASSRADTQRFLLEMSPEGAADQSATVSAISLDVLKSKIRANTTAIGGSPAMKECLAEKLRWAREAKYRQDNHGPWDPGRSYYYYSSTGAIGSGLPAGTRAFTDPDGGTGTTAPAWAGDFPITGRDSALFRTKWPGVADTVRPLPAGVYKFYYDQRPKELIICDGVPKLEQERHEVFITVTAPSGTVHEAFFDPVAIGSAVGADAFNGTLEPKAFTVGAVSTSLQSLKWQGGSMTLNLSSPVSLSGHKLNFIALDGTVAHSLDGGAATVSGGTLTWSVASQPWQAGDKLMLRIRQTGAGTPTPTATSGP